MFTALVILMIIMQWRFVRTKSQCPQQHGTGQGLLPTRHTRGDRRCCGLEQETRTSAIKTSSVPMGNGSDLAQHAWQHQCFARSRKGLFHTQAVLCARKAGHGMNSGTATATAAEVCLHPAESRGSNT